tara:strand:+ start:989 stop:1798 length:810 start_codon:yes stop_codon:yes gene_type:complete
MLKKRIIFTFYYFEGFFVQSRNFSLQKVGTLDWIKRNFNLSSISNFIDELIIVDISKKRNFSKFLLNVEQLSENFFIPIACGGGITNLQQVKELFRGGADKILFNSNLYLNNDLIVETSKIFGEQSIIASIDLKKNSLKNNYEIFVNNGFKKADIDVKSYISKILKMPIGEILLRSIDKDGSGMGLNLDLLNFIPKNISKQIILSGGFGNVNHFEQGLNNIKIDAVCTGNLLNFIGNSLEDARRQLIKDGYKLPIWDKKSLISLKDSLR